MKQGINLKKNFLFYIEVSFYTQDPFNQKFFLCGKKGVCLKEIHLKLKYVSNVK